MTNNLKLCLAVCSVLFLFACKKDKNVAPSQQQGQVQNVYVVGYEKNSNNKKVAKLWKNGVPQTLTDGSQDAVANSIFISDSNVYVAGYDKYMATVWKNGVAQSLASGFANSVYVAGSDVYVVGTEAIAGSFGTTIWKNGVAQNLTAGSGVFPAYANSVFVSGNDVYVAGYIEDGNESDPTAYSYVVWKNGVVQYGGFDADNSSNNFANSVYVSGSDEFAAGCNAPAGGAPNVATVWRNGVAQNLSSGVGNAESVYVANDDVYVAGYDGYVATVWENGFAQPLTDGSHRAVANSVFVLDSNVYVAGYEYEHDTVRTSKIWKNGVVQNLTDGSRDAEALSVFVK